MALELLMLEQTYEHQLKATTSSFQILGSLLTIQILTSTFVSALSWNSLVQGFSFVICVTYFAIS